MTEQEVNVLFAEIEDVVFNWVSKDNADKFLDAVVLALHLLGDDE